MTGAQASQSLLDRGKPRRTIDIVFDGPPDHEAGRFVEIERDGESISIGEWVKRDDGFWALRIPDPEGP